jgi:acetoacetyl-CoA synthetase
MSSTEATSPEGEVLWTPSPERAAASRLAHFQTWLERESGVSCSSYEELWRWSVSDLPAFWRALASYFEVELGGELEPVLEGKLPEVRWFPRATLNFARQLLARRDDHPALIARREDGARRQYSYAELAEAVARARAGLVRCGVTRGDRVVAVLPNAPEAVIGFLASASLGAIWSSAAPEFGVKSVLDRFQQIEPKVLLACDGYRYGGRYFDRRKELSEILTGLPQLSAAFVLGDGELPPPCASPTAVMPWNELMTETAPLTFEQVPFEHPLWILYSSGTTGLPKAIVQGHGGILLEHLKSLALHLDLSHKDRFFWYSTTGWMMWNMLVSGLALGATLLLYDGSPAAPNLSALWNIAADEQITYFGTSAPFLLTCKKAGVVPKDCDLARLRAIGTTGAPLPPDGFRWVYDNVSSDLLLGSVSGGTDVCTAFVLSCPLMPVRAGEIQCRGLGAKVEAWDEAGRALVGEVGELVLTEPLPSMPIGFWNDPDRARFRASYFSHYPGVWRHGDWIKITEHGSSVIYGRSDSTLNRGGVRMGTSEFYQVVEALPEISDSLVVDTGSLSDAVGTLWLFVVTRSGVGLDAALKKRIRDALRTELSPRHVPDEIRAVTDIPRTLNGKKLEVPVKRILLGAAAEQVASRDTLQNPEALDPFIELRGKLSAGQPD